MKTVKIFTFSGTGNTEYISYKIAQNLKKEKIHVDLHAFKEFNEKHIWNDNTLVGLAFPTNSLTLSPFIWKKLKNITPNQSANIFFIYTHNNNAPFTKALKNLLTKKGFNIIGICGFAMPSNMILTDDNKVKSNGELLQKAEEKVNDFVKKIVDEQYWESDPTPGSTIISSLTQHLSLPWRIMRLFFRLETENKKCLSCKICSKVCPVNNIIVNKFPDHLNNCELCMSCISQCPQKAITFKKQKAITVNRQKVPY